MFREKCLYVVYLRIYYYEKEKREWYGQGYKEVLLFVYQFFLLNFIVYFKLLEIFIKKKKRIRVFYKIICLEELFKNIILFIQKGRQVGNIMNIYYCVLVDYV